MNDDRIPHHPVPTTVEPFDELGLSEPILKLLREGGFEHPTPIQASVIPPALRGRDIIALAQTGSGNTAALQIQHVAMIKHGRGLIALYDLTSTEIALRKAVLV